MKKFGFLIAATALVAVSCNTPEPIEEEVTVEVMNYTLDQENSSIQWVGMMSPEYFHTGTIELSEGSITMEDGALTAGNFTVDMTTIKTTDLEGEKATGLENHLKGLDNNEHHKPEDFFNTVEFPNVAVTLGEYKDGMLTTTLDILGQSITQDVKVDITSDENGAKIAGKFKFDFAPANMPGLQANPETGEGIDPMIELDLNVMLTK